MNKFVTVWLARLAMTTNAIDLDPPSAAPALRTHAIVHATRTAM